MTDALDSMINEDTPAYPTLVIYEQTDPAFPLFVGMAMRVTGFGLTFAGSTREEVETKFREFWDTEHPKAAAKLRAGNDAVGSETPSGRGHHLAGKAWVIHEEKGEKFMIPREQLADYLAKGYVQGGARTKVTPRQVGE